MALVVGNLLTDPNAESFITLAGAEAYLNIERNDLWTAMTVNQKEAQLTRASRWLAMNYMWQYPEPFDIVRVGKVTARFAAESFGVELFAGENVTEAPIRTETYGKVSFTYADPLDIEADAGGMRWAWIKRALRGLIVDDSLPGIGVMVV